MEKALEKIRASYNMHFAKNTIDINLGVCNGIYYTLLALENIPEFSSNEKFKNMLQACEDYFPM